MSYRVYLCHLLVLLPLLGVYEGDSLGPPKMDMFEDWGLTPQTVDALELAEEVEAEFEE